MGFSDLHMRGDVVDFENVVAVMIDKYERPYGPLEEFTPICMTNEATGASFFVTLHASDAARREAAYAAAWRAQTDARWDEIDECDGESCDAAAEMMIYARSLASLHEMNFYYLRHDLRRLGFRLDVAF